MEFTERVILAFGFPNQYVQWVMLCVSSPKYSVNINGNLEGNFHGRKGLRHPISPFLFVLAIEYFSKNCALIAQNPVFKFYLRCRHTKTTHVCFANDLIVFCLVIYILLSVCRKLYLLFQHFRVAYK